MISIVTNSTVSTVTTTAIASSFALIGILVLFALLIQKEVTTSADGDRYRMLGRLLNIGIIPLLIAFLLIVATRIYAVLR